MFSFQCESGQVFMCQNQCVRVHQVVLVDNVCVRYYCIDVKYCDGADEMCVCERSSKSLCVRISVSVFIRLC